MKHFLITLLLLLVPLCSSAQHFTFLDIPIDGSPQSMHQALQKKGFRFTTQYADGNICYSGRFMGYDANITVGFTKKSHIAEHVSVSLSFASDEEMDEAYSKIVPDLLDQYHAKSKLVPGLSGVWLESKDGDIQIVIVKSKWFEKRNFPKRSIFAV